MKSIVSQIMGYSKIIFNSLWVITGILGIIYGLKGINTIEVTIMSSLNVIDTNIDIVKDLLNEAIDVIESVDQSLSTIEQSSIDAGLGLIDTRPIVDKTSQVVTQDLPQALDEVQTSMPSVIEAAAMIDQTLYLLSRFKLSLPNPFGTDFEISLGVDYNPTIPLEDALIELSGNLEGMPDQMRSIEGDLATADTNLSIMSENLIDAAYDLDLMREQIADIIPGLENIIVNLENIQDSVGQTHERIPGIVNITQKVFISLMVLFILSQFPSVYIGYLIAKGGFSNGAIVKKGESHV